jgi:hypothetical protein
VSEAFRSNRILAELLRLVQRREELFEHGAVFDGRDEVRFFVTLALNPEKAFRWGRGVVHFLAKFEGQDGVVSALDDHDGNGHFFEFGNSVELAANQKA